MRSLLLIIFLSFLQPNLFAQTKVNIVPMPVELTTSNGAYSLKRTVTVSSNLPQANWIPLLKYFKNELKKWNITVVDAIKGKPADIRFEMHRMPTSGKPAYQMEVDNTGIRIASNFDLSAFHAMQTLFQLIPPAKTGNIEIPFLKIFDHARFEYRGMHLDVSRHYFPFHS